MSIPTFYNEQYYVETDTPSMRKVRYVAEAVKNEKLGHIIDPYNKVSGDYTKEQIKKLHFIDYVFSFLTGEGNLATSNGFDWSDRLRDGVMAMNAGQIAGAQLALLDGIAANVAQGFHHASYSHGEGLCTFNGLALVAQEFASKRVVVIDCDQHGGNGTEEFTERFKNFYNFSINGTRFGMKGSERSVCRTLPSVTEHFELYLSALDDAFQLIISHWFPDLIIYQAGADCHIDDPLGTLGLTTEQMFERDKYVFDFASSFEIPILFVLAGGYQSEEKLTELHVNTFKAANIFYS